MIPTSVRPLLRMVAAGTVLAVALVVSGCSEAPSPSDMPAVPPAAGAPGAPGAPAASPLDAVAAGATDLLVVGQAGQTKGVGDQVRALGGSLVEESQGLLSQVQLAGAVVGAGVSPNVTTALVDLLSRPAADVDPAWLKLAGQQVQQLRDVVSALSAAPDTADGVKTNARAALVKLDALLTSLQGVSAPAGATPPVAVAAGNGGQLAEASSAGWLALGGGGLLAIGVLMVGGAMFRRRATG